MKKSRINSTQGFTLIEILIVIGIIAVLASIVIVAINPAKQFAQARNTQRQSNVETILNAIGQRIADNKGTFDGDFTVGATPYHCPVLSSGNTYNITTTNTSTVVAESFSPTVVLGTVGLGCLTPTYVSTFPEDPVTASGINTGYTLGVDSINRITICAPAAANENSVPSPAAICLTR
ncbi:MAG: prepilin-type N-terminal cleavage/methylation domain-containing protein [Patescibacteria group bacterium]